ncbi:MAG TPA: type II/IV secretion system ATPase subunit [Candidatus Poseidoniia archaeon]|jgi:flagellar protein FlaI|nr:type II/IV secretion system ATPase subunit [Candidatus Poseidoniia archaeon]
MSASKETLDAASSLVEEEEVDESKLSWLQRRRLRKRRAAAAKDGVIHDLVMDDIEIGEDFEELDTYPVYPPFSYVRVLFDKRDYSRFYYVVEPKASKQEQEDLDTIQSVLQRALNIDRDTLDETQEDFLKQAVDDILDSYRLKSRKSNRAKIHYYIERDLIGYGKIDTMMRDPNIEDVSCDGPGVEIFVYHRRFESLRTNVMWEDEQELENYIIRMAQRCGKHISIAEPLLDATLMDGSRIVMTLGREVSTKGSTFTIRRFRDEPFTPVDLLEFKTFSSMQIAFFWLAMQYGMSMLFVGGTASGKTTSLNACSLFLPWQHKIVSIEETRELNLPHPNWIPGCTRQGFGGEGSDTGGKAAGEVDMYDLLRAALRERPEYIIVGEIRGAEAYVLFQAMATGHTTYSTFHADSIQSLVHRLENKPIEIPRVLIPALDGISIQIQTRVGGKRVRRNKAIVEIIGIDPHSHELLTNEAFRWDNTIDEYVFTGKSYIFEKIMMKANLNRVEIMDETKRRQLVIEWCLKKGIRDYKDFARVVAEYYVHPEDVMRQVYEDMQVGGKKRRRKVTERDMDLSRDEEEVDVGDFPPKVRQKYQKREAKEQATRSKKDAQISSTDDPTKRAKLISNEEARREKEEMNLQNALLKDQAYYVPIKQLTPLAKEIDLGDVSSLNELEGRRMLKNVHAELNKRAKATAKIEKLVDDKKSKAIEAEEGRVNKAMISLKSSLANRVQRSANPRWWHSFF